MSNFSESLLTWFQHNGRKTLPWQRDRDPYKIWVSEIMLQQTQVKTVITYFERFIHRFPTVVVLAEAPLGEVLTCWAGLGYYARARNLHKTACILASEHHGIFPHDLPTLQKLPGLGRSTASAILALSAEQPLPILDGNVKRVLTRYCGIVGYPGDKKIEAQLWQKAFTLMPETHVSDYTQAIMDLGALVCTPKNPACLLCPVQPECIASQHNLITTLPTPKPKAPYPTKTTFFLVVTDGNTILLEQRPPSGIWGGLWSLPEAPALAEVSYSDYEILPERVHLFTHYRLLFTPLLIRTDVPQPVHFSDLSKFGLPAPVKRLLDEVQNGLISL